MMDSATFKQTRCAFGKVFQRIPLGFAPELTAVCPGGQLIQHFPEDPTEAARFVERYSHLDLLIGADVAPCGGTEYQPWANVFRIEARGVRPERKRMAELVGAGVLRSEVVTCEWLSRVDWFFVHGPTALYMVFHHPTITDLERSLARLVREKLAVTVEQALNRETPVHFSVQPAPGFTVPRSLSDLAFDLTDLREAA